MVAAAAPGRSTRRIRAERLLRGLDLSLDHDRALQARRLHAGRDRQAARPHTGPCPSTRSIIRASPSTAAADRQRAGRLSRADLSDAPRRPPAGAAADAAAADPTPTTTTATSDRRTRRVLPADRSWAGSPGTPDLRRLGRHRRALCLRHPPADQRPALFRRLCEAGRPAAPHSTGSSSFQDEWGYLLLWATLGIAASRPSLVLIAAPGAVRLAHRSSAATPASSAPSLYFACLGLGYIMVEVGLIANFIDGARQRDRLGLGADHRHAGLLRPRQPRLRAHPRPRRSVHAGRSSSRSALLLIGYGLAPRSASSSWIGTLPYAAAAAAAASC